MRPPPRAIEMQADVRAHSYSYSIVRCKLTESSNTRSYHCHSEGILARPRLSRTRQRFTDTHPGPSCLGTSTRAVIPMNCRSIAAPLSCSLSSMLNVSVATVSSQIKTDTSFMCQRRYRVCAPCLRGGTIQR